MWRPFRNSVERNAPGAGIVFDKFHIMRHLGDALDEVRRNEYRRLQGKERSYIKGQRYTLLSSRENLSLDGRKALHKLLGANRRLNVAYLLKERFGQLWDYRTERGCECLLRAMARQLEVATARALSKVRPHSRETLVRHRLVLPPRQQGQSWIGGGVEQQDPRASAPRLRLPRRGVPEAQDHRHLPASTTEKCPITSTLIREDPESIPRQSHQQEVVMTTRKNFGFRTGGLVGVAIATAMLFLATAFAPQAVAGEPKITDFSFEPDTFRLGENTTMSFSYCDVAGGLRRSTLPRHSYIPVQHARAARSCPPQRGQRLMSIANTRRKRCAQLIAARVRAPVASASSCAGSGGGAGRTRWRWLALGARTP